jgi:succinate dehydrogenase / fumarate reductase cytochrome b subunit
MSSLQTAFVLVLSMLLVGVVVFAVSAVRGALILRSTTADTGWIGRIGRASDRDVQRWAFIAHRVTGVAVFAFLVLHVLDVSLLAVSASRFDDVHHLYGTAPMRVFETLLCAAILFHTFNGLRLVALDVAELGVQTARRLLHAAVALTIVLGALAGIVILRPTFS